MIMITVITMRITVYGKYRNANVIMTTTTIVMATKDNNNDN